AALHVGAGSSGVDPSWPSAGVGESAVFAGAVVLHFVRADELFTDGDLDVEADDSDLNLASSVGGPDAVAGAGEADVAGGVDLAGGRGGGGRRAAAGRAAATGCSA